MKRVEGHSKLYRTDNGAIINTDSVGYSAYIRKRNSAKRQYDDVDILQKQLEEAKSEIQELKELVKKVLEPKNP